MSKYLDRNESIGVVQELMIRAAMSRHTKDDLIKEVENCGIPVAAEVLKIIREDVQKVEWERTYDLLDYCAVMLVWKAVHGSSFRPLFFDILYDLVTQINPKELGKYLKDPRDWKINQFAVAKGRRRSDKVD